MRRFSHINLTIIFCCISFLLSVNADAKDRKGKEVTEADNTFGEGGTKTIFSVRNAQLITYKDVNRNRRLLENIYAPLGSNGYSYRGLTYFNNRGYSDYTKVETFDSRKNLVQALYSVFNAKGEPNDISTWYLENGVRRDFNFSYINNQLVAGTIKVEESYRPVNSAFPRIDLSGLKKQEFGFNVTSRLTPYKSTEVSNKYTGGKDVTEAYIDSDIDGEFKVVKKKAYDKNGVLRHELYQEYYDCGCSYEEEYYYDCYGKLEYRSYVYYDEDGYENEFNEEIYKVGEVVAGYYYYDGCCYGEEYTYDYDKDKYTRGWKPELYWPNRYEAFDNDCPDAKTFWNHEFYIDPMLLKEDGETNFYGLELSYTKHPCDRGGYIGDIRANFGSNFDYKFTRITALLGGVYYPVKTASLKNDFQFSVHGMVGATYLNTKYDNGSFSNSNSNINFTADVGVGINYKINNNWGLGLRAGYAPVFAKGYTANNIAVSVGVIFK